MASPRKPRRRGRPSKTTKVRADDIAILSRKRGRATKKLAKRQAWSFSFIDNDDLAPYLDASWLLADVSEALLRHHVESISSGVRADNGQKQPPLKQGSVQETLARRGIRPRDRGVNKFPAKSRGTMIHEMLTRTKIRGRGNAKIGKGVVGTAARTEIKPGLKVHSLFMAQDQGDYLHVDGRAAKVIDKAVSAWIDKALEGPPGALSDLPEFGPILGKEL